MLTGKEESKEKNGYMGLSFRGNKLPKNAMICWLKDKSMTAQQAERNLRLFSLFCSVHNLNYQIVTIVLSVA